MKGLRVLVALAAALHVVGCLHPIRGFRVGTGLLDTTHHLVGHVCETAEDVIDDEGVLWGVRIIAAAVGQPCESGGRQINIPAALEDEFRKARELRVGQGVEVDGDLAQRALNPEQINQLVSRTTAATLNEPLVARSIKFRQRSK